MPSASAGIAAGAVALDAARAAKRARSPAKPDKIGDDQLIRSDAGAVRACEHNAAVLIMNASEYQELHYDEFLSRTRIGDRDWVDADDIEVLCWLQRTHRVAAFKLGQATTAVRAVAFTRKRDSLRDFIEALPEWDGVARIAAAFVTAWGAPDHALTRAASRNFFVALIARALRPGAKVDTMTVFEGPQGGNKSRGLKALGGGFHAEITAPLGTADFMRELMGVWIAELSELDSLRGRDAATVKRLLSAQEDRFVQKYALHAESYPRRAVAVATTNERHYWQDHTGARRLIPIACGRIDVEAIERERLQWFAEARVAFDAGATWWEFPESVAEEQDARQQVDPWEDALRSLMATGRRRGDQLLAWPQGWVSSAAILRDWLAVEPHQQQQASATRLGRVMRRLGYRPAQNSAKTARGWEPDTAQPIAPEVSAEVSGDVPF